MNDTVERGGIDPTDEEARTLLSILFQERTGDAVRALRAFGDQRAEDARRAPMEAWHRYFDELCDVLFPESLGRGRLIGWKHLIARAQRNVAEGRDAAKRLKAGIYMPWAEAGGKPECIHGCNLGIPCRECDWLLLTEGKPRSMLVKPGHEETTT